MRRKTFSILTPFLFTFLLFSDLDFRLQKDSPCIDAGVDVGLTQDFAGNKVPKGKAPDIGAFEFDPQEEVKKSHSINLEVVILKELNPDFVLESDTATQTVYVGKSASYLISILGVDGFSSSVQLNIKGLPNGTTASFGKNPILPGEQTILTVLVGNNAIPSTYSFVLTANEL